MYLRLLIILSLCVLMGACVNKTVKNISYGDKEFIEVAPENAEFDIILGYTIPNTVSDSDEFHFKTCQSKFIEYSDGSFEFEPMEGSTTTRGVCRDGIGSWCNSSSMINVTNDGVKACLTIRWGGKSSGRVEKTVFSKWEDLPKTIKDETDNLTVVIERKERKTPNK